MTKRNCGSLTGRLETETGVFPLPPLPDTFFSEERVAEAYFENQVRLPCTAYQFKASPVFQGNRSAFSILPQGETNGPIRRFCLTAPVGNSHRGEFCLRSFQRRFGPGRREYRASRGSLQLRFRVSTRELERIRGSDRSSASAGQDRIRGPR